MQKALVVLYLYFILHCSVKSEDKRQHYTKEEQSRRQNYGPVIFANLLYRHGDRAPIKLYPKDPHKGLDIWKKGFGQLIEKGAEKQYKLGQWIRANYRDLIEKTYNYKDIYVISSDVDRCLMSAECNLAAMYQNKPGSSLPFQPVPIHTKPKPMDNMIALKAPCPAYDTLMEENLFSQQTSPNSNKYEQLFTNLSKLSGTTIDDIYDASLIYDTLTVEKEMGLELPEWTNLVFPEPLRTVAVNAFISRTETDFMKKIKGGPLLNDMIGHLVAKAQGKLNPDRKLWIYSGHDDTLIALLHTLGLYKDPISLPSYATLVAMELRKRNDEYYVTMLYKEGTDDTIIELHMDGCNEETCTLQQFINSTKNVTVSESEWKNLCEIQTTTVTYTDIFPMGWLILSIPVLMSLCALTLFARSIKRKKVIKYLKLNTEIQ